VVRSQTNFLIEIHRNHAKFLAQLANLSAGPCAVIFSTIPSALGSNNSLVGASHPKGIKGIIPSGIKVQAHPRN
jgi:hypothetical protein